MQQQPDVDPREVLAYVKREGLVHPECTVEELPPPAYRAYALWKETADRARRRQDYRVRQEAQWWERAKASTRAYHAAQLRKDRIREWGRTHGWPANGRITPELIKAYEVSMEGEAGQGVLF